MSENNKPKIAFFDFSSCEGCQLTVVDLLQTHPELLDAVEIVQFREAMSEKGEDYLVAFIEGSCTRESDEARLKDIREKAAIVVALGACAHLGGINALKYHHPLPEVRSYVYGDKADWYATYDVRPIDAVDDDCLRAGDETRDAGAGGPHVPLVVPGARRRANR